MAESLQNNPRTDANSNNNSNCVIKNSSRSEKSKTFTNGDVIKKAPLSTDESETDRPVKSSSARGSFHEDSISRSTSKDVPFEYDSNIRPNVRSNSADDQLSKTVQNISRSLTSKSQSLGEEGFAAKRNGVAESRKAAVYGFVLVSGKIRQFSQLEKALRPGVIALQYKNDDSLESIMQSSERHLDGKRVRCLAFVGHGSPGKLVICHDQVLSARGSAADQNEIMEFFKGLVDLLMDRGDANARLDFLACPLIANNDGIQVLRNLEDYIKVPVHVSKDMHSSESNGKTDGSSSISELYFKSEMLRSWSGKANQSISNFEKIRTVGKGSYGTAVLYRKKDDDSLVILKETNIHDLSASERQMAKNEVTVLGMLSHPNIISYYDSFEEDGTLWIEMEYADGGTLGQYLSKLEKELDEKEILLMFQEMVSAIKYIHDQNILHRDLKTANIFLTKEGKVKLGDFGIAKIMSTRQDANTVLGTPYYISPEMCEGKPYNEKSDLWALGCILYEMANLQKTFEGTNLPALVNKIMKGSFAPVKEIYSLEFRALVRDLLSKEPNLRPSAQELVLFRLPQLLERFDAKIGKDDYDKSGGKIRSLLFYLDVSTMEHYHIQSGLPSKIQITEVAVAVSHVVVVSMERGIFTWGDNTYGQLGHGDQIERQTPQEVSALRGKSVIRASCGDNFTAFLSDSGLLLTCGQGEFGCLGHGNWIDSHKPKLIDDLMTKNILSVSCGKQHCAAASADGFAFTWGIGDDGRLGLADEKTRCSPTEVSFDERVLVRVVSCFPDGTLFIMDTGAVFACGRNDCNKVRLNPRQGFLQQIKLSRASKNMESAKSPVNVQDLGKYDIENISFGAHHSAILTTSGRVLTMGSNAKGQYGSGHTKQRDAIATVKYGLEDEQISMISCGDSFTLAGSTGDSNILYFWGTKPLKRSRSQAASESASPSQSMNNGTRPLKSQKSSIGSFDDSGLEKTTSLEKSGSISNDIDAGWKSDTEGKGIKSKSRADSAKSLPERISNQGSLPEDIFDEDVEKIDVRREQFLRNLIRQGLKDSSSGLRKMAEKDNQAVMQPTNIIDFSIMRVVDGYEDHEEYPVHLDDIFCCGIHVFLLCNTTAPPSRRKKRVSRKETSNKRFGEQRSFEESSSSHNQEDLNSSSEIGGTGNVPSWIKDELERGIPLDASADASNEDSSDGEDDISAQKIVPKASVRRESSQMTERIPFTRRISNQSISRNRELRYRVSAGQLPSVPDTPRKETTIIDGIAISSSNDNSLIANVVTSSTCVSRSSSVTEIDMTSPVHSAGERPQKTEEAEGVATRQKSFGLSSVFPRPASTPSYLDAVGRGDSGEPSKTLFSSDSGVEFTPVENFTSSFEQNLPKKGAERKGGVGAKKMQAFTERQKPAKSKKNASTPLREKNTEMRPRDTNRGRLAANKARGGYAHERNIVRDEEAAKLCEELKAMRELHEQQEAVLRDVRINAQDSEQRLKEEIDKLQQEKSQALEKLNKAQEDQANAADVKLQAQQKEALDREAALKEEINSLKSELNKQNEKLKENYGILITVQDQLVKLQQERITNLEARNSNNDSQRERSSRSQPNLQSSSPASERRVKSAVCIVM